MDRKIKPPGLPVYLALLALSIAEAYLLNNRFGYTPLLFLLLLAPIDALCVRRARRRVRGLGSTPFRESQRGEAVVFSYAYRNSGSLLVCRLKISLCLAGPEGLKSVAGKVSFDLAPGTVGTVRLSMTPDHIGAYRMRMRKARIYGPVGLFGMKLPVERPAVAVVVPSRGEPAAPGAGEKGGRDENASQPAQGGRSSGSYNGVREYAPGDLLRNVHWKLTAHTRQMMTCLYEEEEDFVTVAVDLRPVRGPAEEALCARDQLCESAYRSVCGLVERGAKVRVVFWDGEELRTLWIKSDADLPEAAVSLASSEPAAEALTDAAGAFPDAGGLLVVSAHLDEGLARRLCEFSGVSRRACFHYIAPADFERETRKAYFDHLAEHGVACSITAAPPARQAKKERLRIERISAWTGENNEKRFHRQQSR